MFDSLHTTEKQAFFEDIAFNRQNCFAKLTRPATTLVARLTFTNSLYCVSILDAYISIIVSVVSSSWALRKANVSLISLHSKNVFPKQGYDSNPDPACR